MNQPIKVISKQKHNSVLTISTNGSDHDKNDDLLYSLHPQPHEKQGGSKKLPTTTSSSLYKMSDMASHVWRRIRQKKTSIPTHTPAHISTFPIGTTLPPLKESSCRSYRSQHNNHNSSSNNNAEKEDDETISKKIQCKNMNSQLAELVGMRHYHNHVRLSNETTWQPPSTHGLDNGGQRIIPEYYLTTNMKDNLLTIDYHYMILDDIRNLRPLNEEQLTYIQNILSEEDKQYIITEYNQVIRNYLSNFMG